MPISQKTLIESIEIRNTLENQIDALTVLKNQVIQERDPSSELDKLVFFAKKDILKAADTVSRLLYFIEGR